MKTSISRLSLACALIVLVLSPSALAQRQLGKKKGPTSKLYIAESIGDTQIQTNDKIYTARQASAFDAPGTVIETKHDSRTAFVYSNGVAMTVGENSRVEINRFEQAPFTADKTTGADSLAEPSSSQSEIHLSRGSMGITTSEFASGSTMECSTPLGTINIRGGNLSIKTTDDETIIDLLNGAATVFANDKNDGGTVMKPGERVIIRRAPIGQAPIFDVGPIPPAELPALTDFVAIAANARTTVTFAVIEKKAALGLDTPPPASTAAASANKQPATTTATAATDSTNSDAAGSSSFESDSTQEIVAKPTVPAQLPINVVVSPDRLPGT